MLLRKTALPLFETLCRLNPRIYEAEVARSYLYLSKSALDMGETTDALDFGLLAIKHYQSADIKGPERLASELAEAWIALSNCYAEANDADKGLNAVQNAVAVLEAAGHRIVERDLADALMFLAISYSETEQNERAVDASGRAVKLFRGVMRSQNPNAANMLVEALKVHSGLLQQAGYELEAYQAIADITEVLLKNPKN